MQQSDIDYSRGDFPLFCRSSYFKAGEETYCLEAVRLTETEWGVRRSDHYAENGLKKRRFSKIKENLSFEDALRELHQFETLELASGQKALSKKPDPSFYQSVIQAYGYLFDLEGSLVKVTSNGEVFDNAVLSEEILTDPDFSLRSSTELAKVEELHIGRLQPKKTILKRHTRRLGFLENLIGHDYEDYLGADLTQERIKLRRNFLEQPKALQEMATFLQVEPHNLILQMVAPMHQAKEQGDNLYYSRDAEKFIAASFYALCGVRAFSKAVAFAQLHPENTVKSYEFSANIPYFYGAQNPQIIHLLQSHGWDVNEAFDQDKRRDEETARLDILQDALAGTTIYSSAVRDSRKTAVLLQRDLSGVKQTTLSNHVLGWCLDQEYSFDTVEALLSLGLNPHGSSSYGANLPIMDAFSRKNWSAVERLARAGALSVSGLPKRFSKAELIVAAFDIIREAPDNIQAQLLHHSRDLLCQKANFQRAGMTDYKEARELGYVLLQDEQCKQAHIILENDTFVKRMKEQKINLMDLLLENGNAFSLSKLSNLPAFLDDWGYQDNSKTVQKILSKRAFPFFDPMFQHPSLGKEVTEQLLTTLITEQSANFLTESSKKTSRLFLKSLKGVVLPTEMAGSLSNLLVQAAFEKPAFLEDAMAAAKFLELPEGQDRDQNNFAHLAAYAGDSELVDFALEHLCKGRSDNKLGLTPTQILSRFHYEENGLIDEEKPTDFSDFRLKKELPVVKDRPLGELPAVSGRVPPPPPPPRPPSSVVEYRGKRISVEKYEAIKQARQERRENRRRKLLSYFQGQKKPEKQCKRCGKPYIHKCPCLKAGIRVWKFKD